jgi:hypothetical protein
LHALRRLLIMGMWLWSLLCWSGGGPLGIEAAQADDGTLSSSPAAGPANALITVNGAGWTRLPDGTPVTFGYSLQDCQPGDYTLAGLAQAVAIEQGSFSGRLSIPAGSQTGTYKICAILGAIPLQAGSYTLLSSAAASISVSPAKVTAGQQATATGSNFLPAGTQVTLILQPAGGSSSTIGSAPADAQGHLSLTFTVPACLSGAGQVEAEAGGGSPPAISASFPLLIVPPPAMPSKVTATPTATPTPRPTPRVTSTATPTKTPARPPATVQRSGRDNRTSATTPAATSGGTPSSSGSFLYGLLAPTAAASSGGLLLFGLCGALLYRRRLAKQTARPAERPSGPTLERPGITRRLAEPDPVDRRVASGAAGQRAGEQEAQARPGHESHGSNGNVPAQAAPAEAPGSAALLETLMRQAQSGLLVLPGRSQERENAAPAPPS